jgi:uncharacterized protein (TIGR02444 family)
VARSRADESTRNPFWDFSVRFYRRPGVAPACLELQDRLGVDVNILLFSIWTARRGIRLQGVTLASAVEFSRHWSGNVVSRLRAVRRFLKPHGVPELRGRVARLELDSERYEQQALRGLLPKRLPEGRGDTALALRSLAAYFTAARLRAGASDRAVLSALLMAAFPRQDPARLRSQLKQL